MMASVKEKSRRLRGGKFVGLICLSDGRWQEGGFVGCLVVKGSVFICLGGSLTLDM